MGRSRRLGLDIDCRPTSPNASRVATIHDPAMPALLLIILLSLLAACDDDDPADPASCPLPHELTSEAALRSGRILLLSVYPVSSLPQGAVSNCA
jgi:hypothetical protein